MKSIETMNGWLTEYAGAGLVPVVSLVALLSIGGAAVGVIFPKYEATALLQFPERDMKLPEKDMKSSERDNTVSLAVFKRVASSYSAAIQLKSFLDVSGQLSPAATRLLVQAEKTGFWSKVATPVLPFSKKDQREYGDIKDAVATAMLGLDLITDARTEQMAADMIDLLAKYYTNAVMRERIRAWAIAGKVDSLGTEKKFRADLVRAELDIELSERRVQDMRQILTKYPDAARMDARQVVSVNASEGGERFLSPLAQLVGFESMISSRREQIRRMERDIRQKQLISAFFSEAEVIVASSVTVETILGGLRELASKKFASADSSKEWVKEATLRIDGALDEFTVAQGQFGVRNGVGVYEVASRSPLRLALMCAVLGFVALAGIALVRFNFQAARKDPGE